ncbi:MAG: hypothetical protein K6E32_00910 [Lachnospiraceae bacterium]|nr:hypothetical protein [Lachnospiraceae bacterium]
MQYLIMAIVAVGLFLVFFFKEYYDASKKDKKRLQKITAGYGKFSDREYSGDELARIALYNARKKNPDSIDDITASDIEFDRLFVAFNTAVSAPGSEFFYHRLRTPIYNKEEISDFEKKVSYLSENREEREKLQADLMSVGSMRGVSFWDCLDLFLDVKGKNLITEFIPIIFLIAAVGIIFIDGSIGVMALVAGLIYNIITYYKARGDIEIYVVCLGFIINFLKVSERMIRHRDGSVFDEISDIKETLKKLETFRRNGRHAVNSGNKFTGVGNPLELLGDYLRMFFHVDIISFYRSLDELKKNRGNIERVYENLGKLDTYIVIASLREALTDHCIPEEGHGIRGLNMYHPLISNPVKNSIETSDRGVLITGSNASGKSTFLKTVLINAIMAKSVHTCTADAFSMDDYRIFSSMSLRDDLQNDDSYFMVEIKAIKRIIDKAEDGDPRPVLCFLDEVLRGTNTIERIAACTSILESLREKKVLCFVATHDIELTGLVADKYDNYYFDETVTDNDISFSYKLKQGSAATRNAIKLLTLMGFSEEITDKAGNMAADFEKTGKWRTV